MMLYQRVIADVTGIADVIGRAVVIGRTDITGRAVDIAAADVRPDS